MDATIEDMGVPEFARIEIRLEGASGSMHLHIVAELLHELADKIEGLDRSSPTATLIAYRHIRATSAKLRGTN